jgi:meso-butanediol dehydrogenase / (S,S)-butanediol dehydrogenase / diacetyl reductase
MEDRAVESGVTLRLRGKAALVTGAARRRGLGFAIATRLAAEGAQVVLSDLPALAAELQAGVAELVAQGRTAVAVCADITSERDVDALFAKALDAVGRLDVLVNNAGVIVTKLVADTTAAEWQRCNDVMGLGTFLCSKRAVEVMARQGAGGRIVNISSISGKRGNPYFGAYTFAKFGIIGLTQTLAAEVAHLGITVNAVCPGTVETDMIDQVRADRVAHGRPEVPPWAQPIPLGRLASAADIAAVVAFLASPEAGYVTGEAINVDGGRVMH